MEETLIDANKIGLAAGHERKTKQSEKLSSMSQERKSSPRKRDLFQKRYQKVKHEPTNSNEKGGRGPKVGARGHSQGAQQPHTV